jgi:hypothetical protein
VISPWTIGNDLSLSDSQFDSFLFAPLYETGETSLSVLSALARQDIDAWQEAARLDQLPKDAAINSLASTIWKSDSERWSPTDASITAASLIEHLPYHLFHQLDLDREHQQQIYDGAGPWDPVGIDRSIRQHAIGLQPTEPHRPWGTETEEGRMRGI